jgi:PAS domain S-box-containing protein
MIHDMIDHASYMAHGYCLLWKPWLVVLHAGSDLLIFAAYFAIPAAIWLFLRQRPDLELRPLAILFAAFIFLCGLTHLIQMVTLWWPIYETQGILKALTAIVSVVTAIMIFPLIPKAVALPSPSALQNANAGLREAMAAREETLGDLRTARTDLEARVAQRTRELEHAKARLEALIKASAQIFWTTSPDGQVIDDSPTWRAFTGQSYDQWRGIGWLDAVHPDDRNLAIAAWREAVANKTTYQVEYRMIEANGAYRWTVARGVPLYADDGTISEWVGMNEDISSRKRAEEHSNLIMRELSHRTKNLLAVIASLARRTFDDRRDPKTQSLEFVERIHGLARSHDLLVRGDWHGVSLGDLVHSHLDPFGFDAARLEIEGPPLILKPEIAQSIGLALHELATNATKHGDIKTGGGRLKVRWHVIEKNSVPTLSLEWHEDTVCDPGKAKASGFGRTVLQQLVGASVGGSTEYTLAGNHLLWRLYAPLESVKVAA